MIKKAIYILLVLSILSYVLYIVALKNCSVESGNRFSIENNSGIEIDSLKITIGNKVSWLYPVKGNINILEGKLRLPLYRKSRRIEILIFENYKEYLIAVDSFDCYKKDCYHNYISNYLKTEYIFSN